MRFMFILKSAGRPAAPSPELGEAMHAMAKREVAAGRMIHDGGLAPRDSGVEVRLKSGRLVVTDGPFAESKEVIGGYAVFELPDQKAAVDSALQFLKLHQELAPGLEITCEIRQVAGSQVELIRSQG